MLSVVSGLRLAGHGVLPLAIEGYSFDPSRARQRASSHRDWLSAVGQAVREESRRGQRVVLVGLSAGASLALGALIDREVAEAVDGLVLMSTSLRLDGWAVPRHQFLLPLALYTPLGRFWHYRERPPFGVKNLRVRGWVARELAERRVSRAGAATIGVPHLRENDRLRRLVTRLLPTLRCKSVLALHAAEDEVASPANVTLVQQQLQADSFRRVLLPDSYHMITIDNDRRDVVRETVRFVDAAAAAAFAPAARPAPQPPAPLHHAAVHL
ncbi:MAG: alpha/beta hydrolase [Burkholderiales bacterium]|nr:alpha/beta hydrolase [Burkholderiales bacterium]MDE2567234.1 alpha/beta hydrolase [Burkholderiales bacterium]